MIVLELLFSSLWLNNIQRFADDGGLFRHGMARMDRVGECGSAAQSADPDRDKLLLRITVPYLSVVILNEATAGSAVEGPLNPRTSCWVVRCDRGPRRAALLRSLG